MKTTIAIAFGLAGLSLAAYAGEPPWSERTIGVSLTFSAARALAERDAEALIARGRDLFTAKFTVLDGAGRPKATQAIVPTKRKRGENASFQRTGGPDANACSGCHNDPIPGAAGEFVANAFVSEGFESADFDSLDAAFSNERNSNTLTGSGLIELLAREMTADLQAQRHAALRQARRSGKPVTVQLETKGVGYGWLAAGADGVVDLSGLRGVDADLIVRPFSQKGVFASLRQFTVNALNVHHGIQADERFGSRWTGVADFDEDGKTRELEAGDVSALVAFQATLPAPHPRTDIGPEWQAAAAEGEAAFTALGCAVCHRPSLPLKSLRFEDPSPYDGAGTLRPSEVEAPIVIDFSTLPWVEHLARNGKGEVLVPLYGDLKRHVIVDEQVASLGNELMGQRFVERDVFMTAELWGVASTAPFGHRGDLGTLDQVIRAHGGEGRAARDAYVTADAQTRSGLIAFLKTFVIEK